MKNVSLALNAILLIAVAILYYLQFSTATPISTEVSSISEIEKEPVSEVIQEKDTNYHSKIGYINVDSLQLNYDFYEELKKKLEKKEQAYDAELKTKSSAFQKKVEEFQRKAPTMTQFEGELKQKELAKEEEALYKIRDQYTQNYELEMVKLNNQLYKAIKDYVVAHNQNTKYDIIIGESQTRNFVLDFNPNIDITNDVIKGLNKKYNEKNSSSNAKP